MKKTSPKRKTAKLRKGKALRSKKGKVFDGWHLYGSLPGIEKEALAELKRMRNEW